MKKRNGFTLVELLAVIVILAIILVIAVPQIMNVIEDARKGAFESSVKSVAAAAENQYAVSEVLGKDKPEGNCLNKDWAGLNAKDYSSCNVSCTTDGVCTVTLEGQGQFKNVGTCGGTKSEITCGCGKTACSSIATATSDK